MHDASRPHTILVLYARSVWPTLQVTSPMRGPAPRTDAIPQTSDDQEEMAHPPACATLVGP
jgi:hypothetical protein